MRFRCPRASTTSYQTVTHPAAAPRYAFITSSLGTDPPSLYCAKILTLKGANGIGYEEPLKNTVTLKAFSLAIAFDVVNIWADFLCVDPSSSAELSEAVNSRFQILQHCEVCFVYLDDVDSGDGVDCLTQTRWRRQCWALQELIAPKEIHFYNKTWSEVGTKRSLLPHLSSLFGIDKEVLQDSNCLADFSIGMRMSWASRLSSERPEDSAYSLLGIFKVSMMAIYGEGQRAFLRLQEEILKDTNDATIFAWQSTGDEQYRGLLARSPSEFAHFGLYSQRTPFQIHGCIQAISAGILIDSVFGESDASSDFILCLAEINTVDGQARHLGVTLKAWRNTYVRSKPSSICRLSKFPTGLLRRICARRDLSSRDSSLIANESSSSLDLIHRASIGRKKKYQDETHPQGINPADTIKPGSYTFVRDGAGGFSVLLENGQASVPLGKMIPIRPHDHGRSEGREILQQIVRNHWPESWEGQPVSPGTESLTDSSSERDVSTFSESSDEAVSILSDQDPLAVHTSALAKKGLEIFSASLLIADEMGTATEEEMGVSFTANKRQKLEDEDWVKVEPINNHEDNEDKEGTQAVTRGRCGSAEVDTGYLACPFGRQNSTKHRTCLKYGGFSTVQHLRDHLWKDHYSPHWCPVCCQTFDSLGACDTHIRQWSCTRRTSRETVLLSSKQWRQISRNKLGRSKEEQWYSIWCIIFPQVEKPPTAYVSTTNPTEWRVRLLRQFWARRGLGIVSDFVSEKLLRFDGQVHHRSEKKGIPALKERVLASMVDQTMNSDRMDGSGTMSRTEWY